MAIDESIIPRSSDYMDKEITETGFILINGTCYYQRTFSDGCAELVRFDQTVHKWVILCFTNVPEST